MANIKTINKSDQFRKIALIVLSALISISFLYVYCHICNDRYSFGMFLRTLVTVAVSFFVYMFLSRFTSFLEKHYIKIVAAFLGIMLILQIVFGYFLEITPNWDFANIYQGAISWAETGVFPNPSDYFYLFPNNLGGMSLLAIVFKIVSIFGIHNYSMAAMVTNAILNILMMLLCFYICKKLVSVKTAIFVLYIFMVSLPSYLGAAVFYTDVLTMIFPVLFYFLYLKLRDTEKRKWQILYLVFMGLTAWIGMTIKFTVVIIAIAIVIELLLRFEFKRLFLGVIVIAAIYAACNFCFYNMIYSHHLSQKVCEQKKLPPTHWIMMGLQGEADYNAEDVAFSTGFSSVEERDSAIAARIKQRISDYGVSGMIDLMTRKAVKCFSDGTYELTAFFYHGMARQTALNDYVTSSGTHYEQYQKLCSGIYLGFFLIMILGGFSNIYTYKKGDRVSPAYITPFLSIFGLLLFLVMWEAHARYITNYIPMIYICAATSMEFLSKIRVRFFLSSSTFLSKM
ncbi:MAG: hypothetical protein NC293_10675 [Roseburia sp.]|nr:hypothetical protein [Roseburia sp.]